MQAMTAQDRWAAALSSWALPQEILDQAPESPWRLPPEAFAGAARAALELPPTPTHERALEALPAGGLVVDVGAGAGAASLPLAARASRIVAVDQSSEMLRELLAIAPRRVVVTTVEGTWPEVRPKVEAADVVVCANVAYNVPALDAFVTALTDTARAQVVMELTSSHPQQPLNWLWQHFWGLRRPEVPTAETAVKVVQETVGVEVEVIRWRSRRPRFDPRDPQAIAWVRQRLCLPEARTDELAQLLRSRDPNQETEMVTLVWRGRA